MKVMLVADIYGFTEGVEQLCGAFEHGGAAVFSLSPYQRVEKFCDEQDAYDHFITECGHRTYAEMVRRTMVTERPNVVIGFSAGASASWLASSWIEEIPVQHLVCYYPTRIRKYLEQPPAFPTTIIFPERESHFGVDELISQLDLYDNIACLKTTLNHGFMNRESSSYSGQAWVAHQKLCHTPFIWGDPQLFREAVVALLRKLAVSSAVRPPPFQV